MCFSQGNKHHLKGDHYPHRFHPSPKNVSNAAAMKDFQLLLENGKTIAVYVIRSSCSTWGFDVDNRVNEIHLQDLGLTTDCELQKIWAGDAESGGYILHVLYTRTGHGHGLASYAVDEKFLAKCVWKNESPDNSIFFWLKSITWPKNIANDHIMW